MALAGRAAVAADRRAPVRSLQRSDADHGGAGRLYQRHRVGVVFARCGHCRAAVRCGRAPGASCRTGARHRAVAGVFLNEDDETLHALTVIVILRESGVSSTPRLLNLSLML